MLIKLMYDKKLLKAKTEVCDYKTVPGALWEGP
jgi:hypothetical protein